VRQSAAYDVVVFGGGPAGAAAALTLSRHGNWTVALVARDGGAEASSRRSGPEAQTLSPGVDALFGYLGIADAFASAAHPRLFGTAAAWGSNVPRSRDFIFSPFGAGWHLDRGRFDRMLTDAAAAAGATILDAVALTDRPVRFDRRSGTWSLSLGRRGGAAETIRTRFLVDATGRQSRLARRLGVPRARIDRLVAVSATLSRLGAADRTTFVEASEHGWWYATPGAAGLTVAFLSDADVVRKTSMTAPAVWERALASTLHLCERTRGLSLSGPLRIHAADSSRLAHAAGEGWIAAGDAAAAHDPLSSSGVPRALASGASAAHAIDTYLRSNRCDALDAYAAAQVRDFDAYARMRSAYYAVERRWQSAPFWSRRYAHA